MKIDTPSGTYIFRFRQENGASIPRNALWSARIHCDIHAVDQTGQWVTAQPVARGTSSCSKSDFWNPITGEKLALARAMKTAGFGRPIRVVVWDKYLRVRGIGSLVPNPKLGEKA